ncbi:uncharacterized protein MELLADRAFT_51433 [Melampsora larici-populina 98AG31]|uniref:Uncharacterized protein n=1 Tax=Melampsora larici-populina (strain 98AG31 / pathotype 3-4-7) TaxID=747676 RepID=F4R6T6_MELLP|nr:uncharacterized protein MELLADRAFT_51433 [Melampsora larici-populina 98AG31]EGG11929.1 hypothetical protein MELLADRAFT_51433 [Melampsora larici-populina 98AG31]
MTISLLISSSHRSIQPSKACRLHNQFRIPKPIISITPLRLFSSSIPSNWKPSTSKRFFVTGHGQFKRSQAGKQHLITGTSHIRKEEINKTHTTKLRKLLPCVGKRAGFRKFNEINSVWWSTGRLQKSGTALESAILRDKEFEKLNFRILG